MARCFCSFRMVDATLIQMSRQEYGRYGSEAMIKVLNNAIMNSVLWYGIMLIGCV